jgi:hypothetical protein
MPDDLDDYELRPRSDYETTVHVPRRRAVWPILSAGLAFIAAAVLGVYLVLYQPWKHPAAPPAPAPAATAAPIASATATHGPLPTLEASDELVRSLASSLSSHPELARWLARTSLIRTLTTVVTNIANGETPRRELDFLAPKQRFKSGGRGTGRIVADPAGYAGYDVFGDAIASIDANGAASVYSATEPLFDAAYRELGFTESFRPALDLAIRELLAVPVPPADAELVPGKGGFRWADPKLEALTAAQKQFLRTGPRNVRLVQAKLRELQAALARSR